MVHPLWMAVRVPVNGLKSLAQHLVFEFKVGSVENESANELYFEGNVQTNDTIEDLAEAVLDSYSADPNVEYIERNYYAYIQGFPDDPRFKKQWALQKIEANRAWSKIHSKGSVVIAIVDTGIDYSHPDLMADIWLNSGEKGKLNGNGKDDDGYDFIDDWHGYDFVDAPGSIGAKGEDMVK